MIVLTYISYYFIEAAKFILGYELVNKEPITKKWLYLLGSIPYLVLILFNVNSLNENMLLVIYFTLLIITALIPTTNIKDGIKRLIILEVFLNALDSIVEVLFSLKGLEYSNNLMNRLICNIVITLIIAIIYTINRLIKKKSNSFKIKTNYPFLGAIYLTVITLGITLMRLFIKYAPEKIQKFELLIALASFVCIICLISMIIYSSETNIKLQQMVEMEKQMSHMKESYYEMLLKKEKDTRRYRHDTMNHYICLKELNLNHKTDELNDYLERLMSQIKTISNKNVAIGNHIIEVLTNYYITQLPSDVNINVSGLLSDDLNIQSNHLSTIYGNVLSNAIDELNRITDRPKALNISFKEGQSYFGICVSNSVQYKRIISSDGIITTSKDDKSNHGFGLKNMKDTVAEVGGSIELKCDDDYFTVNISLKKCV